MLLPFDFSKSLEELENDYWGEADDADTGLVKKCHQLRHKPLNEFTPDDCRFLLGQDIGVEYLVPMALQWLKDNPVMEAMMFNGDLLLNVLRLSATFWKRHPHLWWEVRKIATDVELLKEILDEEVMPQLKRFVNYQPEPDFYGNMPS